MLPRDLVMLAPSVMMLAFISFSAAGCGVVLAAGVSLVFTAALLVSAWFIATK